jgi:hypothetical protein
MANTRGTTVTGPAEKLFETERKQFRPLLLSNRNYFGNIESLVGVPNLIRA